MIAPGIAFALTAFTAAWMPDPNVVRWGIVLVAAVASCAVLARAQFDRVDFAIMAFVAWCVASVAWSPDRLASVDAAEKVLAVAIVAMAMRRIDLRWVLSAACVGIVAAMVFGSAPFAGFGNPEMLAWFALIALPLTGISVAGFASALFLIVLWVSVTFTSAIWVTLSLAVAVPFLVRKWWQRIAAASALMAGTVFAVLVSDEVANGVATRLDLAAGTIAAWWAAPLFGHGIGSFLYVFPMFQGAGAALSLLPFDVNAATYANAAHNEYLQLLMETGIVGAALASWVVVENWRSREVALGARLALVIAAVMCLVGFPMQIPATVALVVMAIARVSPTSPVHGARRKLAIPVAVAGAVAMAIVVALVPAKVIAQAHMSAVMRYMQPAILYDKASAAMALNNALKAYDLDRADARIRLAVFQTAALTYERWHDPSSRAGVDAAWLVAQSASPSHTSALLTRLRVLVRDDDCYASDECVRIANELVRTASRTQEVQQLRRFRAWQPEK